MKATGVVRRIDDLGRVVMPKETRKVLGWNEGDPVEFYTLNEDSIIIKKYTPGCIFCGNLDTATYKDKRICHGCMAELKRVSL